MSVHEHFRVLSDMKMLIIIFFPCIFAAVMILGNDGEIVCIPNATFHIDCNKCKCSPNGMSIDCTDWLCATLTIPYDILLNVTLNCWSGEIFLYNGYKCLCSPRGDWAMCSSARYELSLNLRPRSGSIISLVESVDKCTPGSVFKNDKCDTCICAESGEEAACLGIGCITGINGHKLPGFEAACHYLTDMSQKLCIPSSTFSVDCNQCICSNDGYSMLCDPHPCIGVEMRDDQLLNITFHCEPGTAFLYNRHECLCSESGKHALCSLAHPGKIREFREANKKVLSIAEFSELCTPGMTFKDKCNVCICGAEERAACTKTDCDLVWKYSSTWFDGSARNTTAHRIVRKEEIWRQRSKNSRFCKKNDSSMYCRYLRWF